MPDEPLKIAARFFGGPADGMILPVPVPLRLRHDLVWNVEIREPMEDLEIPLAPVKTQLIGYRLREYFIALPLLDHRRVRVYVLEGINPRVVVSDVRAAYQWPHEFDVHDNDPSSLAIR